MKRSEVISKITQTILNDDTQFKLNEAEALKILEVLDSLNIRPVDEMNEVMSYEPEEGYDAYFAEQDRLDRLRDFQLSDGYLATKSTYIVRMFLEGSSFEEIAELHNVTIERVRQTVSLYRRKFKKE